MKNYAIVYRFYGKDEDFVVVQAESAEVAVDDLVDRVTRDELEGLDVLEDCPADEVEDRIQGFRDMVDVLFVFSSDSPIREGF
jgi:hypothetical protein